MADVAFFMHYGEVSRIVGYFAEPSNTVAARIFELHRRHASGVCRVFDAAISAHASALRERSLPANCLLSLVVGQHDAVKAHPAPSRESKEVPTIGTEIRIAVDEKGERVVFDRWGEIKGKCAMLLIALAAPFREATHDELAPENFRFTKTVDLLRQTHCANEETIRRRVLRCRNWIAKMAKCAGDPRPSIEAVIENNQWHGYRLNPDRVRIVALSELRMGR
jgi:hypothetical protein